MIVFTALHRNLQLCCSGNISPRSAGTFDRSPGGLVTSSTPLPRPDGAWTRWASVGSAGARLALPDSGVSLTVPEGAVSPGQAVELFISLVHDSKVSNATKTYACKSENNISNI